MSDARPDPDALLAEVQQHDARAARGKLKVFFGMSAGVGKTYAMLEEASARAAEGVDVVVGYAEPHIRFDTERLLLGLEVLPAKLVEYRGATLKEFDLDAALARRPAVCCVDELAHTNAAGLRHAKRWQDVHELLAAGVDVYSTLNVQHLESVNDLVERITGVRVRETLPDRVFDAADEVEIIDIAPEELLGRFREGRIYKPEQAERAAKHFFLKGNLIALRELALRKVAERVDDQLAEHRRAERTGRVVPAGEKVLVCVGPSPLAPRLVRSARRLATGIRASKLIAAAVELQGRRGSPEARARIEQTLRLAEELGAETVTLAGASVAAEVLAYARQHNVTKVVVGKPDQARWRDALFGSVVDDLIRGSGDEIDVYVIRGPEEKGSAPQLPRTLPQRVAERDWAGYALALAVALLVTAVGWPLHHRLGFGSANVLMLYLLGVLLVAATRSRSASVLASVLSVLLFDLVFVPPYYSFAVRDREYVVTFAAMLATALTISALVARVRGAADSARTRERRTAALLGLARDLASARELDAIARATERHVGDFLAAPAKLLVAARQGQPLTSPSGMPPDAKELGVAQWAFDHAQPAGRGTATLPAADATHAPLVGGRGAVGVLAVYGANGDGPFSGERRQLVEAFAGSAALAVERARLADEARAAWRRVESEALRNTLLSGVSHELRTPLAGIVGAAGALAGGVADDAARRELLDTLVGEAERMDRLVENLLDMTRMEAGGLALRREWVPVSDVVGAALHAVGRRLKGRAVTTDVAADLPLARWDEAAVRQALVNLLDNAAEHTPAGTPIDVTARREDEAVCIEVADRGPGLPAGSEARVFDKFWRAEGTSRRGVGLGLAIARAVVEAHGGRARAENRAGGGALFTLALPLGGTPPTVDASA